nr:MAG TPA: hypothetical protein [Caudoviricetes sp.]
MSRTEVVCACFSIGRVFTNPFNLLFISILVSFIKFL